MSAKFDEEAHNSSVSIMFTRSKRDSQTRTLTDGRMQMRCAGLIRRSGTDTELYLLFCYNALYIMNLFSLFYNVQD